MATSLGFNRRGGYLAIGWSSGELGVFDVLTRCACVCLRRMYIRTYVCTFICTFVVLSSLAPHLTAPPTIPPPVRSIACRVRQAHTRAITGVCWSRDSRHLLTCSYDKRLVRAPHTA
jgi:WD40 repeat protein